MSKLTIYRASAGSGKTFRLAYEYLCLLLEEPNAYRHIMAVTFTNKATDEMKTRIISELNLLAHDAEKSPYISLLCSRLKTGIPALQQLAAETLQRLLHDFSEFNICTIDRFFQRTTRAFTREIGLQGGYNLEIEGNRVLQQAIDNMLFELENPQSTSLLQWLLRFSEERIESGLSWDIRRDIGGLSQEIFNETYKSFRDELLKITADKTFLREYAKKLRTVRKAFENEVVACAERALSLMADRGLSPDRFKNGSRSPFFLFEKWRAGVMKGPTETFVRLADNPEGWFTRKTDDATVEAIRQVYGEGLNDCVKKMVDLYGKGGYERYLTAVETGRYLFTLGILSDIDRHIQAYQQEHNLLLLSDTADLLHRIIDDSDTPFVYEKIGTRIEHFMIDEFQDTSNLQWENFRPLFRESLDKGQACLIVGDVKQSIYRWRNSDWRLLASGLRRSFDASKCEEQLLNTNYRSCKQIVAFNNSFFTAAAQLLQDKFNALLDAGACSGDREPLSTRIVDAYCDVPQQVSPAYESSDGHVQISFIDAPSTDDFKEEVLGRIPDLLIRLQQNGYRLRDMAFLVRNKADGVLIADTLLRYKASCRDERFRFDIISDESLYISSSPSVRFLVNMLAYLYNPKETLRSILATYEYEISQSGTTPQQALSAFFDGGEDSFAAQVERRMDEFRALSLYDLCQKIISFLPSEVLSREQIFIQAFEDLVLDFTASHAADMAAFLTWWNERGASLSVFTPESQDAIRIMTIHKSKGLDFKVVIMPFCDWSIDHSPTHTQILWCRTQGEPFEDIPLVPVRYSSVLERTAYSSDYFREKAFAYIDNLNLAYVAFTRAREEMILFAPQPASETVNSVATLMYAIVRASRSVVVPGVPCTVLSDAFCPETGVFELGSWWHPADKGIPVHVATVAAGSRQAEPGERFRLKMRHIGFFENSEQIKYGNLMHEILSGIRYPEELKSAVAPYVLSGELSQEEAAEVVRYLEEAISSPSVREWFSPAVEVWNEMEIWHPDGKILRPDRVVVSLNEAWVIDYKFGKTERTSYLKQVRRYAAVLSQMGYTSVKGYIWYVALQKIVPVYST